jgi:hypothetical protein
LPINGWDILDVNHRYSIGRKVTAVISLFVSASGAGQLEITSAVILLLLEVGIIAAAVGAWRGSNKSRVALLILVSIHYLLIGFYSLTLMLSGDVPPDMEVRFIGRILRGALLPALYIWYFSRSNTKDFFLADE